jgi:hypothetical protein
MTAQPRPRSPRPIPLGLLGLALMLAGWKASTYVPLTPRQAEQARQADEVRGLAEQDELKGKIDGIVRGAQPPPPYQLPGRLLFGAGLVLFVAAGVRMYRQAPPPEEEAPVGPTS